MSLDATRYSTIANVQDTAPIQIESEISDLVTKLLTHVVVSAKVFAGLYSGCLFSAGRLLRNADEVAFIVLDFDNTEQVRVPGQPGAVTRKTGQCIPNPVTPQVVEQLLRSQNIRAVVTTSHSHTLAWPKFRVVVFTGDAIPPHVYKEIVMEFLAFSGLGSAAFAAGMDRSSFDASRFYYWPSHPPEHAAEKYAAYIDGETYMLEDTVFKAPEPVRGRPPAGGSTQSPNPGHWSADQIRNYYFHVVPGIRKHSNVELKAACPVHGGTNPNNFCVDTRTGYWHCFSECAANGVRGGGIYAFHWNHRNANLPPGVLPISYGVAKDEVHVLIGRPTPASVAAFQQQVTAITTPAELQQAVQSVNNMPLAQRDQAVEALKTAHPTATTMIEEHLMPIDLSAPFPEPSAGKQPANSPFLGKTSTARDVHIRNTYNTRINTAKFDLSEKGVFRLDIVGSGGKEFVKETDISPAPIWLTRAGLQTGTEFSTLWYKVNYAYAWGPPMSLWVTHSDLVNKEYKNLPNFPVDIKNHYDIANYFSSSIAEFGKEALLESVTTHYGWQSVLVDPVTFATKDTLVLYPTDAELDGGHITTVGKTLLQTQGRREPWIDILTRIGAESFDDFAVFYAFLGMSVAAPLVRYCEIRNPILMSAFASSSGKSTVAEFAGSIWSHHSDITIAAQSSVKGTEDKTLAFQDLPIVVEEFQRQSVRNYDEADAILYALANGQRRTLSSKDLKVQGGEIRKGVNLVVSEEDCASQYAKGANIRVLLLTSKPLPDEKWSYALKNVYHTHYGVLGPELAAMYNKSRDIYLIDFKIICQQLEATKAPFTGDDLRAIALIGVGLKVLERLTKVKMPVQELLDFMVAQILPSRTALKYAYDTVDQVFVDMLTAIVNGPWNAPGGSNDWCETNNEGGIAVRNNQLMLPDTVMEILHDCKPMRTAMNRHGVKNNNIVNDWCARGYLLARPGSRNMPSKHVRANINKLPATDFKFDGRLVHCVTPLGMAKVDPTYRMPDPTTLPVQPPVG